MPDTHREEQFRVLYDANYTRVLGYALRRTSSAEDAADVVADAFLVAWRRFDELPPGDEARLWLYGVARRVLANHHRGERRRSALREQLAREVREAVHEDPLPAGGESLSRAWRTLRPADRDLLGLVVWEGLRNEEVAAVLGCSRTVAKVRLHRARKRFAQQLEAAGEPVKPTAAARHEEGGRAPARPGTEET